MSSFSQTHNDPEAGGSSAPGQNVRLRVVLSVVVLAAGMLVWLFGIVRVVPFPVKVGGAGMLLLLCVGFVFTGRPAFARLLTVLLACFVAVLLFDSALRIIHPKVIYFRAHETLVREWPPLPRLIRYAPNARYTGRVFGDLGAFSKDPSIREYREMVFQTDDRGFRNEPERLRPPYDLVVLGDSFGVGIGTTQEATWSRQLADRYGLSVINLSMPGDPRRLLVNFLIEKDRVPMGPDAVLLLALFSGNDLQEVKDPRSLIPHLTTLNRVEQAQVMLRNFQRRSPIHILIRRWIPSQVKVMARQQVEIRPFVDGRPMAFYKPYLATTALGPDQVRSHENVENLRNLIADFKRVCDVMDTRLKVVLFPAKSEVYRWVVRKAAPWSSSPSPSGLSVVVSAQCAKLGVPFLDLKPDLIRRSKTIWESQGQLLWYRDDTHPNPAGHAAAAELIYSALIQQPGDDR